MGYLGKLLGGVTGFMFGGPPGAVMGAAFGHAADSGKLKGFKLNRSLPLGPLRLAALLGQKDQVFSLSVIALSAKLARCDGPVNRAEIDSFKRMFNVTPESLKDVGRIFDQARENPADFTPYAAHLAETFADHVGVREEVLNALFAIAKADGKLTAPEISFLSAVTSALKLDKATFNRARDGTARRASPSEDPYAVLGVKPDAGDIEIRAAWKKLMRENHPDSLASRGVPPDFIARSHAKVAGINAAWDVVKRERGL